MFWLVIEPPLTTSLQMDDLADSAFGDLWPCEALNFMNTRLVKLMNIVYSCYICFTTRFLVKKLTFRNVLLAGMLTNQTFYTWLRTKLWFYFRWKIFYFNYQHGLLYYWFKDTEQYVMICLCCVSGSSVSSVPTVWSRPRQPVSTRTMDRVPQGETDVSFLSNIIKESENNH